MSRPKCKELHETHYFLLKYNYYIHTKSDIVTKLYNLKYVHVPVYLFHYRFLSPRCLYTCSHPTTSIVKSILGTAMMYDIKQFQKKCIKTVYTNKFHCIVNLHFQSLYLCPLGSQRVCHQSHHLQHKHPPHLQLTLHSWQYDIPVDQSRKIRHSCTSK